MSLDRRDPKTAIPQLEKRLNELNTVQENALARFDTITDALARQADANARYMANQVLRINGDLADLQNQVDGNITTWFYAYAPTLSNYPADEWVDAGTENVHLGDIFYDTDSGYAYRFVSDGATPPTYSWLQISDSAVVRALANAQHAQDTADGKRRVFVVQPTPPYDVGDLWCEGLAGDILTCTTAKDENGSYSSSDWTKLNKYTDDTEALEAQRLANNAQTSADGKNTIYYSEPTQGTILTIGDTWFKAEENNAIYRWSGSEWVKEELGEDAIADLSITNAKIADGTIQSAKIGSLDAGKITSGTINAARIDASTLTIGGSNLATQANVSDAIDSIEVGARNLVLGTGSPKDITIRSGTNKTDYLYPFSDYAFGDGRLLYLNAGGYTTVALATISFDWETTDTTGTFFLQNNNIPWRIFSPTITVTNSNQSGHVIFTHAKWSSSSYTTLPTTGISIRTDNMTAGKTLTISNLKIELGNTATDWTPAPEDIDTSLDDMRISEYSESGSVVTFDSGGLAPMQVAVTLDPIQNLNGYDKPWVGGAGKNLLDGRTATSSTVNNVVWTVNFDGTIKANGTATADSQNYISINVPAGDYYFSGCPSGGATTSNYNVYIWDNTTGARAKKWDGSTQVSSDTGASADNQVQILSGHNYTFNCRVMNGYNAQNIVFKPMIRKSTEADGIFAPYENICPISGHTEVDVVRTGKNLIPNSATTETKNGLTFTVNSDGSVKVTGTASAETTCYMVASASRALDAYLIDGQSYTLTGCPNGGGNSTYSLQVMYGGSTWQQDYGSGKTFTYSSLSGNALYRILIKSGQALGTSGITFYPMVRFSSVTDSTYEPYNGTTYTTALGRTVYGGTLDLISGLLTVTHGHVNLGGLSWTRNNSEYSYPYFYSQGLSNYSYTPDMLCDRYPVVNGGKANLTTDDTLSFYSSVSTRIAIRNDSYTDATTFKTSLSGAQLIYKLATPQTYQLEPQQIEAIVGTNTVWSSEDNIAVNYLRGGSEAVNQLNLANTYINSAENRVGYTLGDYATNNALKNLETFAKEYIGDTGYIRASGSLLTIGMDNYSVGLSPTAMIFYDKITPVAAVGNSELMIPTVRINNFVWTENSDGRLLLKYSKQ